MTRREMLGLGVGAAAGLIALPFPRTLSALGFDDRRLAPIDNLDVALKAARWIRRSRIETKNGVTWPADPLQPASTRYDLYNGMPGVILFHLELFYATGDKTWLDDARLGANELTAQLPAIEKAQSYGFYEGLGGAVFVLEETHRATNDPQYREAAKRALSMIHAGAVLASDKASWPGPSATNDIISGSAGIGLLLLWADETMDEPQSRTLAMAAGRHLVEAGIPANGGHKWNVGNDVKVLYPNFAHGTAGVCYFLASLMKVMEDRTFMAAALSGVKYLDSVSTGAPDEFKVFHHEPGGEDLYYLSWCHGPAGTARLFQRMEQITQRPKWDALVERAAKATIASGVPEKQSAGYWNNISQCCGNAGVGEFFIDLQRAKPTPAYADMISRVQRNTLDRATADADGLKWIQAENRVSPLAVVAQTGYMQGAAGVGSFYLHADALAKGQRRAIRWPDSPAFELCVDSKPSSTTDMSSLSGSKPKCHP
ncbi:MAG: lanthionine synthetase LanC family protein [Gemmatimonadaceae bacterium]